MLSLRLASSCRVSEAEEPATEMDTGATAAHTGDDDDGRAQSQSGMTQDQGRDHQNHLNLLPVHLDARYLYLTWARGYGDTLGWDCGVPN